MNTADHCWIQWHIKLIPSPKHLPYIGWTEISPDEVAQLEASAKEMEIQDAENFKYSQISTTRFSMPCYVKCN